MLHGITWEQYLAGAGVLTGLYYLAVVLWGYRRDLQLLLAGERGGSPGELPPAEAEAAPPFLTYEELEQVAAALRHGILEEAGRGAGKEDLLRRVHTILASYGGLRAPASRGAIHHYIIRLVQELCGVTLREEELQREWDRPPDGGGGKEQDV